MEAIGRHTKINIFLQKKVYQNGSSIFDLLGFHVSRNTSLNNKRYHWRKELIEIDNLHMF